LVAEESGRTPSRRRRWRWLAAAVVAVLCLSLVATAAWTDVDARTRTRHEQSAATVAKIRLVRLRREVTSMEGVKRSTTAKRDELAAFVQITLGHLWTTNLSLNSAKVTQ